MRQTKYYRWTLALAIALLAQEPVTAAEVAPGMLTIERFSAERGDPNSQFFMGQRYEQGDGGVPQDLGQALEWYRKAAEQGHGPAQFKLGQFHELGLAGLSPAPDLAQQWYGKAASNGSKLALDLFAEKEREEQERDRNRQREAEAEQQRRRQAEIAREQENQRRAARERERRQMAAAAAPKPSASKADKGPKLTPAQLLEHIAAGPWREARDRPAEFLPTGDMNCLKSGENQITCFSEERARDVSESRLTFSVKAVLEDFGADSSFNVRYIYNVLEKESRSANAGRDSYGLGLARGWQQPGYSAECRLRELGRVECEGTRFGKREFRAN